MKIILIIGIIIFIGVGGYFLLRGNFYIPNEDNGGGNKNVIDKSLGKPQATEDVIVKEFNMRAFKWAFDPAIITVNKGDKVKLHITSEDVTHGFNLPAFGINENLTPGETVNIEFIADKAGIFSFACSVFCGSGHSDMTGQLIVK